MESPLPHFKEHQCYAYARDMVKKIGNRPKHVATEDFLAGHITKPMTLRPDEVRRIARFYWRTFYVEPYGERTRIHLR